MGRLRRERTPETSRRKVAAPDRKLCSMTVRARSQTYPAADGHAGRASSGVGRDTISGMNRRKFLASSSAAGLTAAAAENAPKNMFYSLYHFYMRSGPQVERTTTYLRDAFLPAAKRNGMGPVGFFSPVVGERSPYILSLVCYPSFASIDARCRCKS